MINIKTTFILFLFITLLITSPLLTVFSLSSIVIKSITLNSDCIIQISLKI